jgi:hypothetical protein
MAEQAPISDIEARREALLRQGVAHDRVAAAVATFNAVSGLMSPPQLVSSAEIRFSTSLNP